jgi:uncharacterized membrane protein YfcA
VDYLPLYMGIGVLAGVLAGLLGIGGGAITVPLLLWAFAVQGISDAVATHMALASSLGAMIVTSASSAWAHNRRGAVLWPVLLFLGLGVVVGSVVGVLTAVELSGASLQIAFGFFLAYVALQMMVGFAPSAARKLPGKTGLLGAGGVIGCVSMYFGIGGGSLTVPFLSYCGVVPARAVGTSAALGLPIALWGTALYIASGWNVQGLPDHALGFVHLPAVLGIVATSAFCAPLGAALAHRLKASQLRSVFGIVLLGIAAELLWSNLG